jgi:hypothetical protein
MGALTKERLSELFMLRARAKIEEREVDAEFLREWGFSPFDREAVEIAGRHWVVERWAELRDAKPAIIAYEEADRALAPDERQALWDMIDLEWGYDMPPPLDLLMDLLEARQRSRTH